MKERPILFSVPMVRAILEGRKTQTRRVVKPQPSARYYLRSGENVPAGEAWGCEWDGDDHHGMELHQQTIHCPYGRPGDRLWVRESGLHLRGALFELFIHDATPDYFWASPDHGGKKLTPEARGWRGAGIGPSLTRDQHKASGFKARPSIHMPRWASRITLEVTAVRVERLQEISAEDCIAEGLSATLREHDAVMHLVEQYRQLWESINSPGSWSANPWVWVIEFARIDAQQVSA